MSTVLKMIFFVPQGNLCVWLDGVKSLKRIFFWKKLLKLIFQIFHINVLIPRCLLSLVHIQKKFAQKEEKYFFLSFGKKSSLQEISLVSISPTSCEQLFWSKILFFCIFVCNFKLGLYIFGKSWQAVFLNVGKNWLKTCGFQLVILAPLKKHENCSSMQK